MENAWYLKVADKEVGPLSAQQLKAMADRGQVSPGDPVRLGSDGRWVPASSVRGLLPQGEPLTEQADSGHIPVAKRLDEPPGGPQPTEKPDPKPAGPATAPAGAPQAGIPVARAIESLGDLATSDRPSSSAPASAQPPSAGSPSVGPFAIHAEDDSVVSRYARPRGAAATGPNSRRKREIVVVGVVLLVVALGVAAGAYVLSRGGSASASRDARASAQDAASAAGEEREEVVIPGLDEYLGEAPPEDTGEVDLDGPADDGWTDASASPVECGDVRVKIASAEIGRPRLVSRSSQRAARPKSDFLSLRIELYNKSKTRKLEYRSWSAESAGVTLVDNYENQYSIKSFAHQGLGLEGQVEGGKASLYPEEVTRDALLFEKPAKQAKFLRLELPARAFGKKGALKFEIPISMIAVTEKPEEGPEPGGVAEVPGAKATRVKPAQDQAMEEPDDRGPIPIPGVTGVGNGEGGGISNSVDDPKP